MKKLRIAMIVTTLKATGPVIVAKNICTKLLSEYGNSIEKIVVYSFDEIKENIFPSEIAVARINLLKPIPFEEYDIIHTHMIRPDFYMWFWQYLWGKKGCKWVSTLHQDVYRDLIFRFGKLCATLIYYPWIFALRKAGLVCCVSDTIRKNVPLRNTEVIYNGIPVIDKKIYNSSIYNLLSEIKKKYTVLGVCGNLFKVKGFEQIIKALPELPGMALILLGDGIEKNNLISLAKDYKVEERCFFLGFQNNAPVYYKWFDIFILSSRSEGCCQSGLEANQAGLPIVCSAIKPFQEIYSSSQVAFFELDNISSLVNAIQRINLNRKHYSEHSEEIYRKNFTDTIMTSRYYHIYLELLENR